MNEFKMLEALMQIPFSELALLINITKTFSKIGCKSMALTGVNIYLYCDLRLRQAFRAFCSDLCFSLTTDRIHTYASQQDLHRAYLGINRRKL